MSLIHRLFNIYLGESTALLGVVASFLSLGFFWNESTTFLGTCILLFSVPITDIGYQSLHSFYHLSENLVPDSISTQIAVLHAVSYHALNVFELAHKWLLVVVALERLLFSPLKRFSTVVGSDLGCSGRDSGDGGRNAGGGSIAPTQTANCVSES